jgi:hypothetical protein
MAGAAAQRMPGNPEYALYSAIPKSDITARQTAEMAVSLGNTLTAFGKTTPNPNIAWRTPRATQAGLGKAFKAHDLASIS